MKQFEIKTIVTNCRQCPYRDFDGVPYCSGLPVARYQEEYSVYQENKEQLTDSCPEVNK